MSPTSNPTTIDPQALARSLEKDNRFRRHTGVGRVYHQVDEDAAVAPEARA